MTEVKLTPHEIMHNEIIRLLDMVAGDPNEFTRMAQRLRYNIDHLEEIKHDQNPKKDNIQYAINGLRKLTLELEEIRDKQVVSYNALNFFAEQYKYYINRMKNEKNDIKPKIIKRTTINKRR